MISLVSRDQTTNFIARYCLQYKYGTLHKKLCEVSRAASQGFAAAASRVVFASVATAWRATLRKVWLHTLYGFLVKRNY